MNRITYIDIAKGIGIFLVIAGHLFRYDSYISAVIFSFHIPLFFFLSGMVEHYQDIKFPEYLKKALRSCFVPWLLFALLGLFVSLLNLEWRLAFNTGKAIKCIYGMDTGLIHVSQIWFLISLFYVKVFFWFFHRYVMKNGSIVLVMFLVIAITIFQKLAVAGAELFLPYNRLPMQIDNAFTGLVFYIGGFIYNKYKGETSEWANRCIFFICLLLILVSPYNTHINVANIYLGEDDYLFYVFAISGIFLVILLSKFIERSSCALFRYILQYVGESSLYIFAVHSFGLQLWACIISRYRQETISCMGNMNNFDCLIGTIVVLVFSCFLCFLLQNIQKSFYKRIGAVANIGRKRN